ncbi:BLUF domain-containing protein [Mucilaginibacter robiniae]|uniref:BLUF domain-containing protein n=1 Tax=Mucilaginibacter robiniae TaxID=2728022 RepID=A0A7L5E1G1_9SPHI|nr:BLUF domain-containing protein [Mucilaginibacter robiniae]QJD96139.1 BLUF domain-containing protein [Mucilaginibacter robiniae]
MLYYLIYISKAMRLMQENDLNDILKVSLDWNLGHDLTGMLLYVEGKFLNQTAGRFIQVLEGDEQKVKYTFSKIKQDSRHHNITMVDQGKIQERNFASWSMGFKSLNKEDYKELPGFFELDHKFVSTSSKSINVPLNFLKSFYDMHMPVHSN